MAPTGTALDGQVVVVVRAGTYRVALRAADVVEVQPLVLVSPLPGAPEGIEGVVDVHGELLAVLDLARRLGAGAAPARLDDKLVVVQRARGRLVLHVEPEVAVVALEPGDVRPGDVDGLAPLGVAVLADGLVVVHDVDAFLSATEDERLRAALVAVEAGR